MKTQFNCETCGNPTLFKSQYCRKCISEIAKYPLDKTSVIRCIYELDIINKLPEQDQERHESYRKQLETKIFMQVTSHI